jgi:hypothetical protein
MPLDKIHDIVLTEILFHRQHGFQHNEQSILRLMLFLWMQSVVTVMAVLLVIFLAEIMKQHLSPTNR